MCLTEVIIHEVGRTGCYIQKLIKNQFTAQNTEEMSGNKNECKVPICSSILNYQRMQVSINFSSFKHTNYKNTSPFKMHTHFI
jgi:hypothetical protein